MRKVGVISLGCDKNRVDTENMLYVLQSSGSYSIVQKIEEADVVIINTCAFLEKSRVEAIDTILQITSETKKQKIVVTGCLPQKYVDELMIEMPEVDAFLGINSYDKTVEILDDLFAKDSRINAVEKDFKAKLFKGRVVTTVQHSAFLKIAEGCNNHCTYCTIPSIRGRYTSFEIEELFEEAKKLAEMGVKELSLVAQDTTKYGTDLYGQKMIVQLIRKLSEIDGIEWIRLLYAYPEDVTDELIEEIANNPKVCKYIDIPLQHISNRILKLMARRISKEKIQELINKLRCKIPNIAIRSTFIVGFPGETEEDFKELLEFLNEYRLDNVGFFAYSLEEDTPSAKLPNHLSDAIKEKREKQAYSVQAKISYRKNKEKIGDVVRVLFDGLNFDEYKFYGRTEQMAIDVDGVVWLEGKKELEAGQFYEVKIVDAMNYDLKGEVL